MAPSRLKLRRRASTESADGNDEHSIAVPPAVRQRKEQVNTGSASSHAVMQRPPLRTKSDVSVNVLRPIVPLRSPLANCSPNSAAAAAATLHANDLDSEPLDAPISSQTACSQLLDVVDVPVEHDNINSNPLIEPADEPMTMESNLKHVSPVEGSEGDDDCQSEASGCPSEWDDSCDILSAYVGSEQHVMDADPNNGDDDDADVVFVPNEPTSGDPRNYDLERASSMNDGGLTPARTEVSCVGADVVGFLCGLGFLRHLTRFEEHQVVDMTVVRQLTNMDLIEIGILTANERMTLIRAAAATAATTAATTAAAVGASDTIVTPTVIIDEDGDDNGGGGGNRALTAPRIATTGRAAISRSNTPLGQLSLFNFVSRAAGTVSGAIQDRVQGSVASITRFFTPNNSGSSSGVGAAAALQAGHGTVGMGRDVGGAAAGRGGGGAGGSRGGGRTRGVGGRGRGRGRGGGGFWPKSTTTVIGLGKDVPGTDWVFDHFRYKPAQATGDPQLYWLSHFHSDHYGGLTKSFKNGLVYCSEITARLVKMRLGVAQEYLRPLPMLTPTVVQGVTVTLLPANHCPGAAMILFEVPWRGRFLHTGDFRFDDTMRDLHAFRDLQTNPLDVLYLDTTYCGPQHRFPPKQVAIDFVIQTIEAQAFQPRTLFVVGAYSIGKEDVYLAAAEKLGWSVCVARERYRMLETMDLPVQHMRLITTDASASRIHVVPMGHLTFPRLQELAKSLGSHFQTIIAFKPTGWSFGGHGKYGGASAGGAGSSTVAGVGAGVGAGAGVGGALGSVTMKGVSRQCRGNTVIYAVPYSEHSSFDELRQAVAFFKAKEIVPTVNAATADKAKEQLVHFDDIRHNVK